MRFELAKNGHTTSPSLTRYRDVDLNYVDAGPRRIREVHFVSNSK